MSSTNTPSAEYLSTATAALTSQTPVSPSEARVAQIPLQSFNLPTFPPDAFTAGLTSLILTADIKLDDYTDLLTQPFSIPSLPSSISNLTLELFSLGYPPGFLSELGKALPALRSLTLYSQLLFGTTTASSDDALLFAKARTGLQELHLLDVFASPGQFTKLSEALSPSLKFLEINYTYRHSDPQFRSSILSKELAGFAKGGLVALTLSISAPDVTDDEEDREGTELGIVPIGGADAKGFVEKLVGSSKGLVMLDLTMFELTVGDASRILDASEKVKVLGLTIGLETGWEDVFKLLVSKDRGIEVLEIVGVPEEVMVEKMKEIDGDLLIQEKFLASLDDNCKHLKSLKVSILRTKMQHWIKDGDVWRKAT